MSLQLKLDNVSGRYRETTYQFNQDHGSIYDTWNNMGAPENMSVNQLNYLKNTEYPKEDVNTIYIEESYMKTIKLPVHGLYLITLEKQ